jgi:hypothetical protein
MLGCHPRIAVPEVWCLPALQAWPYTYGDLQGRQLPHPAEEMVFGLKTRSGE